MSAKMGRVDAEVQPGGREENRELELLDEAFRGMGRAWFVTVFIAPWGFLLLADALSRLPSAIDGIELRASAWVKRTRWIALPVLPLFISNTYSRPVVDLPLGAHIVLLTMMVAVSLAVAVHVRAFAVDLGRWAEARGNEDLVGRWREARVAAEAAALTSAFFVIVTLLLSAAGEPWLVRATPATEEFDVVGVPLATSGMGEVMTILLFVIAPCVLFALGRAFNRTTVWIESLCRSASPADAAEQRAPTK